MKYTQTTLKKPTKQKSGAKPEGHKPGQVKSKISSILGRLVLQNRLKVKKGR